MHTLHAASAYCIYLDRNERCSSIANVAIDNLYGDEQMAWRSTRAQLPAVWYHCLSHCSAMPSMSMPTILNLAGIFYKICSTVYSLNVSYNNVIIASGHKRAIYQNCMHAQGVKQSVLCVAPLVQSPLDLLSLHHQGSWYTVSSFLLFFLLKLCLFLLFKATWTLSRKKLSENHHIIELGA